MVFDFAYFFLASSFPTFKIVIFLFDDVSFCFVFSGDLFFSFVYLPERI